MTKPVDPPRVRRRIWIFAIGLVVVAAAVAIPLVLRGPGDEATRVSEIDLDRLGTISLTTGELNGDANPSSNQAVHNGDWTVQLRGHFDCSSCRRLDGQSGTTGTVLRLTLGEGSFVIRDRVLADVPTDLSKIGKVVELPTVWDRPPGLYPAVQKLADPGTSFSAHAVYADRSAVAALLPDAGTAGDGWDWVVEATGRFGADTRVLLVFPAAQGAVQQDEPTLTARGASADLDLAKLGNVAPVTA